MRFRSGFLRAGMLAVVLSSVGLAFGQEGPSSQEEEGPAASQQGEPPLEVAQAAAVAPAEPGLISLDFRDADIQTVLQALGRKAKINIVTGKGVEAQVTIHLDDVSWEQALETIVKTYGLGFERNDNVVVVDTVEELKAQREAMKELADIESVATKVIQLKYLDAQDVKEFLEPQLTPQGRISVLEMTGQKGWAFGTPKAGGSKEEKTRKRIERETARSKSIVITDTPTTINRIEKLLVKIDLLPKQILIESRVMEVSRDLLRDINLGAVTGATAGGTALAIATQPGSKRAGSKLTEIAGGIQQGVFTPSIFGPETTALTAAIGGAEFFFSKLHGTQFTALLDLLEEDVRTNTLSAPHVLTLSGQEARVLIGEKYPILKTEVSGTSTTTTTTSLDYYQNIGIELYVVPQVSGEKHIDMIIHPVVSVRTATLGTNAYPILNTREAETQVLLEQGETIVIGGLLKDIKSKSRIGLPFLGKLPLVGPLFARSTNDIEKIDLLIFLTARVVEPGSMTMEQTQQLQERYNDYFHEKLSFENKRLKPAARKPDSTPAEKMTSSNRGVLYQKP